MPQRLAQHLIARGLLKASTVDEAMRRMARQGGSLDTNLLEMTAISEAGMLQAVSDVSGVRLVNLSDFEPNPEAGPLMPFKMAKQLGVVPLSVDGIALHIACTYPIPQNQLKDVGFLLGRKLELWVSLECRVKNWQAMVYGQPLEPRIAQLVASLDPPKRISKIVAPPEVQRRAVSTLEHESLSPEVLERFARGIIYEPVLLSSPKKKGPKAPGPALGDEDSKTSVVDPTAYSRYAAKSAAALGDTDAVATMEQPAPNAEDANDRTRVLDTTGYENFAKGLSGSPAETLPPTGIRFPGGVAPPRRSAPTAEMPTARVHSEPANWVRPALPSRPGLERPSAAPPPPPTSSSPTVETPALKPAPALAPPPPPPDAVDSSAAPTPPPPPPPSPPQPAPTPALPSKTAAALAASAQADDGAVEPPLIEATVSSEFTELSDNEADFSDVNAALDAAPAPAPAPVRSSSSKVAPAVAKGPPSPSPSVPAPTASSAWQVGPATSSFSPPPTPLLPAVPLAGVTLTPGDPNISQSPPGLGPSNATEWTLAQARTSLKGATQDRDALVSVMLDYGRRTFEYVAAFAVLRGAAYGWEARGDGDLSPIRELAIPLDAASVFRTVALTRGSYVGPLPPDALSQHYLALLGRSPRTVFVWPVEVQSKLVAIIYGDCGARPVSQRRLSDFILFCQDLPAAFHDLIVFRKLNPPVAPQFSEPSPAGQQAEAPTDADWFHGLMSLLTGPDPAERSMAMGELLKTPEASAQALAAAFPGPTGWSRLPVVELPEPDELGPIPGALARLGAVGAVALAPLLDSADSDTRYLALLTAGSLRYPDVVDGVMRGLFDLEPDISSAARSAAGWLKYLPAFQTRMPQLRQELAASDPLRRSLAARALGVLHDREAIDGLINLTGSEDELCATSAAEALKEVTRASFGTNPRAWTAWWASARSRRRIEWLVEALSSDDFDLRLSAIEELSRTFGDNHGFFADGPREERANSVARWLEVIAGRPDLEL